LKYDGYRACSMSSKGRLTLRNGRTIKRFGALAWALVPLIDAETAILDGEIVTLGLKRLADLSGSHAATE
jgi:ATP-dependent DNA ligase